jgi:protocatechuate 3,4-dioxygenase beta subunit
MPLLPLSLLLPLLLLATAPKSLALTDANVLNTYILPTPSHSLDAKFNVVLSYSSMPESATAAPCPGYTSDLVTISDVQGPYYLPPLDVPNPDSFPVRESACVRNPICAENDGCADSDYVGMPLVISGSAYGTAGDVCWKLDNVTIDLWSADPRGNYWKYDGFWRRHLEDEEEDEEEEDEASFYNCRAHGYSNAQGEYSFSTLMPGHYVAGNDFRPRHLHMKAVSEDGKSIVTQVYFKGDPYLGDKDIGCGICKSDEEDLIVGMILKDGDGGEVEFTLSELESVGVLAWDGYTSSPTESPAESPTESPTKSPTESSTTSPTTSPAEDSSTDSPTKGEEEETIIPDGSGNRVRVGLGTFCVSLLANLIA